MNIFFKKMHLEMLYQNMNILFKKMHLKLLSAKGQPFC